jgi:hypothetical protein
MPTLSSCASRLACRTSSMDVVDEGGEPVHVLPHHAAELLALVLGKALALQRLHAELDRGERALELVGDRVDEAVLLPDLEDLAGEEDREHHEHAHDDDERDHAEHKQPDVLDDLTVVGDPSRDEDRPADQEERRKRDRHGAEGDRHGDRADCSARHERHP